MAALSRGLYDYACPDAQRMGHLPPCLERSFAMSVSRRDFLGAGAAAAAGIALPKISSAMPVITVRDRAELIPPAKAFAGRPVIISSSNGFRSKDNGVPGIQKAYNMMVGGADPLDAAVAGVTVIELDPTDQSVGLGGLLLAARSSDAARRRPGRASCRSS